MKRISQTLIKAFKEENFCPRKINETCIIKAVSIETPSMLKGQIFEDLCFGDDTAIERIPKLKRNNQIPTDYQRIINQSEVFRNEVIKKYGLKIIEKKKKITFQHSSDILLSGEIDIYGEIHDSSISSEPVIAIIDLKLTGDINSQYGSFSWAMPMSMDHTQAFQYAYMWKKLFGYEPAFYYMVFDYKPRSEYKVIRKSITDENIAFFIEDVEKTSEKIDHYSRSGWEEIASSEQCRNCPLKENCKAYMNRKPIEIV